MDILGFGSFVESNDIKTVIGRLQMTMSMVPIVRTLGILPDGKDTRKFQIIGHDPNLSIFSFSDTFVLASQDDSAASFFQVRGDCYIQLLSFCCELAGARSHYMW